MCAPSPKLLGDGMKLIWVVHTRIVKAKFIPIYILLLQLLLYIWEYKLIDHIFKMEVLGTLFCSEN